MPFTGEDEQKSPLLQGEDFFRRPMVHDRVFLRPNLKRLQRFDGRKRHLFNAGEDDVEIQVSLMCLEWRPLGEGGGRVSEMVAVDFVPSDLYPSKWERRQVSRLEEVNPPVDVWRHPTVPGQITQSIKYHSRSTPNSVLHTCWAAPYSPAMFPRAAPTTRTPRNPGIRSFSIRAWAPWMA